jgi:hypothetical protein
MVIELCYEVGKRRTNAADLGFIRKKRRETSSASPM